MIKKRHKLKYIIAVLLLCFTLVIIYFIVSIIIFPPKPQDRSATLLQIKKNKNLYYCKNNWLRQSNSGLYEMYIEGNAFERGVINGKLTKTLAEKQEDDFIGQIKKMVPSMAYLHFLKYFVAWFNRNLDEYIPEEYRLEIYGISLSASDKYASIGPKYQRLLNYHAAHDIGHFLQEKNLVVGCTSFSTWNEKSSDSSLIVGRNFDFFVGDDFAENKIISFTNPEKGYKFMTVTWAGMIGAVSGMNNQGLCLTINAAKSDIPTSSGTPIAIVAREILQYASTIDEALAIAKKRKTFIAQSMLVGSAKDNKSAIIEKTIDDTQIFESDTNYIVCANHFQSNALKNIEANISHLKDSHTSFRFNRLNQLLKEQGKIDILGAASILRDQKGMNGKNIGLGNERSLNNLIAHHSIIFKPKQNKFWVSTKPFQLGKYVCYDLNKIFSKYPGLTEDQEISDVAMNIPEDNFLNSIEYQNFARYKSLLFQIKHEKDKLIDNELSNTFINSNPEFYLVYQTLGEHYLKFKQFEKARANFKLALTKEIPWKNDSIYIVKSLEKIKSNSIN